MKFHTIGNYGVVYMAEISLFAEGTNIERIMELKIKMLVNGAILNRYAVGN